MGVFPEACRREPRAARAVFRATILISANFKGIFAKDGKRQLKSTGARGRHREGERVVGWGWEVEEKEEGIVDWLTCHL